MSPKPEPPADAGLVTATVTRRVRPGHEAACEEALAGLGGAARAFPGYPGEVVFRPPGGTGGEYRIIYRFDSPAHLHSWLDSDERAAWLQHAEPHAAGAMRTQFLTIRCGVTVSWSSPRAPPATQTQRSRRKVK